MFKPTFTLTPPIARALMSIEADRRAVDVLPIDVPLLASLRESARLQATHHSTRIEGNRLTQAQVQDVVRGSTFPGRERDEHEVRHYYKALAHLERLAARGAPFQERDLQSLHGVVMNGRAAPTRYRDGQNVIRDARTRGIVYLPPEASDVPKLMRDLVQWINRQLRAAELPAPIIAAIAHAQYATIHPYYDGNGRTARLVTSLILHASGYGLKGIYSLDEYYSADLPSYYAALTLGPSHNYYAGRAEADLTPFIAYFCKGVAHSFNVIHAQAAKAATRSAPDLSPRLRDLEPRERKLLELFRDHGSATSAEIASHLALSPRTIARLAQDWIVSGLLIMSNPSKKSRTFRLTPAFESLLR